MNLTKKDILNYYESFKDRPPSTPMWGEFINSIRHNLLNSDINNFFSWPAIIQSMGGTIERDFCIALKKELEKLSNYKCKWSNVIVPESIGNGTTSHIPAGKVSHSYYLSRLEKHTSFDVKNINYILEFGGGFGNMCSVLHNIGFSGKYEIFDFPELLTIQYFYLSQHNIHNIIQNSDCNNINVSDEQSLFISTHSIEESPREFMNVVLKKICNVKYFLFTYSGGKGELENFCKQNTRICVVEDIPKCTGSFVMVGEK